MRRREFVAEIALTSMAGALKLPAQSSANESSSQASSGTSSDLSKILLGSAAGTLRGEMLYRKLGNTGVVVSAIGLCGSHFGSPQLSEQESIRLQHATGWALMRNPYRRLLRNLRARGLGSR